MFKIAICDDESLFTEELRELLSGYMTEKVLLLKWIHIVPGKH